MVADNRRYIALVLVLFIFAPSVSGQLPQNNWQNQPQYSNQQQQYGDTQNQADDGNCCEEYCYATDEELYLSFGTKTAYDSLSRRSGNQHLVPECTPVQFWTIIRHGTNLPDAERIGKLRSLNRLREEISRNYEQRRTYPDRGKLCHQDYDLLRRWSWNDSLTEAREFSLTSQGVEDMKLLARRYKSKYSPLLQGSYDERSYYFQYVNKDKIHDSYQAYIEGLFSSDAFRVHANTYNDDRFSRSDENCKNHMESFEGPQDAMVEYDRFLKKPEYVQMVRDVFRRLGFKYSLNASVISDIYDMCRYEKAWNIQQRSPWCIAFTKNHLKLLEYGEDLLYYYKTGYGNKMSKKTGCASVKDLFDRFEKTINGDTDGNKATFFFTDSATIQSVLTAMDIAKDFTPLTADNYYQQARRNWKTSNIDPFASNLAATLYQCRGDEKYKVMFFLNEIPVDLPECSVGLCNWSTIQQKYQSLVNSCNNMCGDNSSASLYINHILLYTFIALLMFNFRF